MISFWRDCMNCDEVWLGSRCQQMFTNVAHELCFLHAVIFQYILNSCPHDGCIVFKGWNSALLCCGCSEMSTGLLSTLLLVSVVRLVQKKQSFWADSPKGCVCAWVKPHVKALVKDWAQFMSAALLWKVLLDKWTQAGVSCPAWEQGHCCSIISAGSLGTLSLCALYPGLG